MSATNNFIILNNFTIAINDDSLEAVEAVGVQLVSMQDDTKVRNTSKKC